MKTGLCSPRAAANAASTWASLAASCQAMPATSPCAAVVVAAAAAGGLRSVAGADERDERARSGEDSDARLSSHRGLR